jgi:uncharacterized protein (TIGR02646 family)
MIHVKRTTVRPPVVLTGDDSAGTTETKRVIGFMEQLRGAAAAAVGGPVKRKSFAFSVYGHQEVKESLARLFRGKCAYCETRYAATQPVDVEHFRPKAGVDEDPDHPGYYWLAAAWDNLYPSCIDCNRERIQQLAGEPDSNPRKLKLGKGNRFPLAAGSPRRATHQDAQVEQPLLLDPCADQPAEFLEFTDDAVVLPRTRRSGVERARASIEIYGLNRTGLVFNRLEVVRLLQARMYGVNRLAAVLDRPLDRDTRDLLEDLLSHELAQLQAFADPERPYSQMCRQVIERFGAQLAGITRDMWRRGDQTPEVDG